MTVQDFEASIDSVLVAGTALRPIRRNQDVSRLDHAVYFDRDTIRSADNDGLLKALILFVHP